MSTSAKRNKFAIEVLVNKMLDEFPNSVWTSSTTTFLDPAMGGGQFLKEIVRRLTEAGHSPENIKERVYGYEGNRFAIRDAKFKLGNTVTIERKDFINDEINMNFDVTITNPPFQDIQKNPLYYKFHNKCVEITKPNGIVAMVTPKAMIQGLTLGKVKGKKNVEQRKIKMVSVENTLAEFFNVGSTFCYYVLENVPFEDNDYKVILEDGSTTYTKINPLNMGSSCSITNSIISKCFSYKKMYYNQAWVTPGKNCVKDPNGKSEVAVRINKDDTFETYKVTHHVPHKMVGVPKVLVDAYGTKAKVDYTHNLINAKEHMLVTVPTNSDDEGEILVELLNSNLQLWFGKYMKRGGMVAFLSHFKGVPLTHHWTNNELYKHFNLTQDEINHIEDNV